MHCTTLSGRVRIYGGWVEKFLRLLLWELSGGLGGKETGMPFQRQVPRWIYFIREPWARYYRAGNSMVPPKNLLVRPFEVFRLRVLAVVMMASAPCIVCADAVVASVSPVPTEVAPFLANQKGDATAPSALGSSPEDSSEDASEDPPDMSHSFCLGSREVLTGIFPIEVRTTGESLRPDTLRRGPVPSMAASFFGNFHRFGVPRNQSLRCVVQNQARFGLNLWMRGVAQGFLAEDTRLQLDAARAGLC